MKSLVSVVIAMSALLGLLACGGTASRTPAPEGPGFMADLARELDRRLDDAEVMPEGQGVRLRLPTAGLFAEDQANVPAAALPRLEKLADILRRFDATRVRIEGHVNPTGNDERHDSLSLLRAQAIAGVLAGDGVEMKRLVITGQGGRQPVADPETELGRLKNERVELLIEPDPERWTPPAVAPVDSSDG